MSIDQLQIFKRQYFKSVNQLILRIYKSIFALFLLYPELNDFASPEHSLFDKMYQMQMVSHCFAQKNQGNLNEIMKMELPVPMSFEGDIEKLLGGPGIKVKPMHEIQEASKTIKNKINDLLENMYLNNSLSPEFFITSSTLREVWSRDIIGDFDPQSKFENFKIGLDVVKMAL